MTVLPSLVSTMAARRNTVAFRAVTNIRSALAGGLMATTIVACEGASVAPVFRDNPAGTPVGTGVATLQALKFAPDSLVLRQGGNGVLQLTGTLSNGTTMSVTDAAWSATSAGVVSVNPATGAITPMSVGKTYLTATKGGVQARASVEVQRSLARADIKPDALCVRVGFDYQFVMHTYDDAGVEVLPGPTTWSVSDPSAASISADGKLHSVKGARITVTGTARGMSDSSVAVLDPAPLGTAMTCQ
jgi:hypothetical protein